MGLIEERNGKLEFEFAGKSVVVDTRDVQQAIRVLVQLIATLDRRVPKPN